MHRILAHLTAEERDQIIRKEKVHADLRFRGEAKQQRDINVNDTYQDTLVDPFGYELNRKMWLHNKMPIVAELPNKELIRHWKTPNDMFYMRHHFPVPNIKMKEHVLVVKGLGLPDQGIELNMNDIRFRFPQKTIVVTSMCTGNRRSEMQKEVPSTSGLPWKIGGLSTAEWTGVRLCDVLAHCGFHFDHPGVKYVNFEGADRSKRGQTFGSSIPVHCAQPHHDVLLAYQMNGVDIPHIHGYPLRVIIPGKTAARSIKWLNLIELSSQQHQGHYQQVAYKVWTPSKSFKGMDMSKIPPIMDLPVTGGIASLSDGDEIKANSKLQLKGYAFAGGGRAILRAEVSLDHGKSWVNCDLIPDGQIDGSKWAWTFWTCDIKVPEQVGEITLSFKATDSSHTSMPDTLKGLYNPRGYLTNQWHRLKVKVVA